MTDPPYLPEIAELFESETKSRQAFFRKEKKEKKRKSEDALPVLRFDFTHLNIGSLTAK
jgi:hypothetical protein